MNLAHATMGLCLAGVVVSAKAELAPNCANAAPGVALASPALHEPKTAVACDTGSGIAAAREAAQLRLYDAPRDTRASLSSTPRMDAADVDSTTARPLNASQRRVLALAPRVLAVAHRYDIDPLLLHAIAHVESRHNPQARSNAGALGVLQVMPATARRFGVEDAAGALYDPAVNLEVGAAYLKTLQARFGNDLQLVLAAYNAGEGAVERHGRSVPPYAETRAYVRQVLAEYAALRAAFAQAAPQEPR
ncbi:lytic transglycosylase domain-containing protein [Scleromatobacter humisilvae]|uniref:Lytic transglycosylase domain-containing protein n=1 Tax=Scleromatobacter humisilvae TaxID=2897159 RepID=A0A9X1YPP7_9BURK|nr:lytic transglycosylase domain-containing protein [Scleromatobacter humisilvae]MCK9689535.1 lytic transglycosylase domain-containing protein [Scleromatobacter humisilvae]